MIDPGPSRHFSKDRKRAPIRDLLLGPGDEVPVDVMGRNGCSNSVYESSLAVQCMTFMSAARRHPAPFGASEPASSLTRSPKSVQQYISKGLNQC
jgi:hypothetical protein